MRLAMSDDHSEKLPNLSGFLAPLGRRLRTGICIGCLVAELWGHAPHYRCERCYGHVALEARPAALPARLQHVPERLPVIPVIEFTRTEVVTTTVVSSFASIPYEALARVEGSATVPYDSMPSDVSSGSSLAV